MTFFSFCPGRGGLVNGIDSGDSYLKAEVGAFFWPEAVWDRGAEAERVRVVKGKVRRTPPPRTAS